MYHRSYKVNLYCDFKLQNYPFDKQICTLNIKVPPDDTTFVKLNLTGYKIPSSSSQLTQLARKHGSITDFFIDNDNFWRNFR
jgi:hypothetical protein